MPNVRIELPSAQDTKEATLFEALSQYCFGLITFAELLTVLVAFEMDRQAGLN